MAKLKIRGHELRMVDLGSARTRDIVRLQQESGIKLPELKQLSEESELFRIVCASFLSQRNAGMEPSWDELYDGPIEGLGQLIAEEGDKRRAAELEGEQSPDPQSPAESATADDAAAEHPEPTTTEPV